MPDLNVLNPEQRLAVETTEGPLLVLAGAGSGKTRVLTYRVAHLIDKGVLPWKILAITFTNKAAGEMLSRIQELTGERGEGAWISTFHSCCVRILRRDIEKLGYKRSFTIYDADDSLTVVRAVMKEMHLDEKKFPPKQLRAIISDAKNRMLTPEEWLASQQNTRDNKEKAEVYRRYDKRLRASDALDFDDLLIKTLELFAQQPPVLDYYQQRFDYVLVDEYQDTNAAQYELIRLITLKKRNLCVVGDDDQSIYGWRGADLRNILEFEKDYPETRTIKLEQNYRSTSNILDAANQVIAHNTGRKEKVLWTEHDAGAPIEIYRAVDERDEAQFIVRSCAKHIANGANPGDLAVLYRTNAQSRVLEEVFIHRGIKYRVFGGQRFYERKEIKDLLAYMRLLVNPSDDVSFLRVINEPKRGIGQATVEVLTEFAREREISLMQAAMCAEEAHLGPRALKPIAGFVKLMLDLTEAVFTQNPEEFFQTLVDQTKYVYYLEQTPGDESSGRIENIKELHGAIAEYQKRNPEGTLSDYLENVALISDYDSIQEGGGAVTLTTLHSAKGLEFNIVYIPGCENGVFPTTRALFDDSSLEEERRLAYVGITRAKKELILCHAVQRRLYNTFQNNPRSMFLDEIPPRLIHTATLTGKATVPPPSRAPMRTAPLPQRPMTTPKVVESAARANAPLKHFDVGDRIYHRTFGIGTVVKAYGEGRAQRVEIEFSNQKVRVFSSNDAPINKL